MSDGLNTTAFLCEISTPPTEAAAVARRGDACAESGSEPEALRIALAIDETIDDVKLLHGAMILAERIDRTRAAS